MVASTRFTAVRCMKFGQTTSPCFVVLSTALIPWRCSSTITLRSSSAICIQIGCTSPSVTDVEISLERTSLWPESLFSSEYTKIPYSPTPNVTRLLSSNTTLSFGLTRSEYRRNTRSVVVPTCTYLNLNRSLYVVNTVERSVKSTFAPPRGKAAWIHENQE